MWAPAVDFSKYVNDNESIDNQVCSDEQGEPSQVLRLRGRGDMRELALALQDLVAWVTAGFLHIPHAEDIPNTVTVGNGGGVLLRPHNYFNQDPSIDSPDSVYVDQKAPESCETNRMACLAQESCSPVLEPFQYNGFEGVMRFEDWE